MRSGHFIIASRDQALRDIIGWRVDKFRDIVRSHLLGWVRCEEGSQLGDVSEFRVQPRLFALSCEDDGHPVVDGSDELIWRGRDYGERLKLSAVGFLPPVPETREGEEIAALQRDPERDLALALLAPLVEAVSGNQAAPLCKQPLEGGLLGQCLGPSVYHPVPYRRIFRPHGNEAPADGLEGFLPVGINYDRHVLARRDVEPWLKERDIALQVKANPKFAELL